MKEIPGYEGLYACDEEGNVYSLERNILKKNGRDQHINARKLKSAINNPGYLKVSLSKNNTHKTYDIHRLMGITFLLISSDKEINHIDGNKKNNNLNNLEICTRKQNQQHAFKLGLIKNIGTNHHYYSITPEIRKKVRILLSTTDLSQLKIGKIVGICQTAVSAIKLNKFPHREL